MLGNKLKICSVKLGRVRLTLFRDWHLDYRHVGWNDYGSTFRIWDVGPVRVRITDKEEN